MAPVVVSWLLALGVTFATHQVSSVVVLDTTGDCSLLGIK